MLVYNTYRDVEETNCEMATASSAEEWTAHGYLGGIAENESGWTTDCTYTSSSYSYHNTDDGQQTGRVCVDDGFGGVHFNCYGNETIQYSGRGNGYGVTRSGSNGWSLTGFYTQEGGNTTIFEYDATYNTYQSQRGFTNTTGGSGSSSWSSQEQGPFTRSFYPQTVTTTSVQTTKNITYATVESEYLPSTASDTYEGDFGTSSYGYITYLGQDRQVTFISNIASTTTRSVIGRADTPSTRNFNVPLVIDTIVIPEENDLIYYASESPAESSEGDWSDWAELIDSPITISASLTTILYTNFTSTDGALPTVLQSFTISHDGVTLRSFTANSSQAVAIPTARQIFIGANDVDPTTVAEFGEKETNLTYGSFSQVRAFSFPQSFSTTYYKYSTGAAIIATITNYNQLRLDNNYIVPDLPSTTTIGSIFYSPGPREDTIISYSESFISIQYYNNTFTNDHNFEAGGGTTSKVVSQVSMGNILRGYTLGDTVIAPGNIQGFAGINTAGEPDQVYRAFSADIGGELPAVNYYIDGLTSLAAMDNISVIVMPTDDTFQLLYETYDGGDDYGSTLGQIFCSVSSINTTGATLSVSHVFQTESSDTNNSTYTLYTTVTDSIALGLISASDRDVGYYLNYYYQQFGYGGLQSATEVAASVARFDRRVKFTFVDEEGKTSEAISSFTVGEIQEIPSSVNVADSVIPYDTLTAAGGFFPLIFTKYYTGYDPSGTVG